METILLFAQGMSLAFLAAWLTIGAFENLYHPTLNETYTSEVLDMARLRDNYPEAYEIVAYRRVTNPLIRKTLFRLIVAWELLAAIALWVGVAALAFAAIGYVDTETARAFGVLAAMMFTSVWAGFLVAGNWWCYWFGHEGAQITHFHMTMWGMANVIFISVV